MKRSLTTILTLVFALGLAGDVAAQNDALERSGTEREQHAQSIFSGVFGQCRDQVGADASGVVAIVFSVGESGKFGATATMKEDQGKSVMRDLARCMGDRANQARHFPADDDKTIVGVKYRVNSNGKLLMLGAGEAKTLRDGDVFRWARQDPSGGNS